MTTPIDIAFNHSPGFKIFQVSGFANAINTTTFDMIGPSLGAVSTTPGGDADSIHLLDTSDTLTVVAASGLDTGLVAVNYLDADWFERVAIYEMDAQSKTLDVAGNSHTARRVNQARYVDGANVGAIDFRINGDLLARIGAGDGLANSCLYTLPKGQVVTLAGLYVASQANRPVEVRLRAKVPGSEPFLLNHIPAQQTVALVNLPIPRRIKDIDFSDPQNIVEINAGIDLFVDARRETGAITTAQVGAVLSFAAKMTGEDPDAPGFTSTLIS